MTVADLYEDYEQKLHAFALRLTRDPYRADDLVQETFVRTMGHIELLGRLEPYERRAWLYRTLKNLFLDEVEARRRQEALAERLSIEVPSAVFPEEEAFDPFALVPEQDRGLLEKRYALGMTSREIADELGVPAATVRWRLHRAVEKLRARKRRFDSYLDR